jgi:hypothetical protein
VSSKVVERYYRVFGLSLVSEIELPDLIEIEKTQADVAIRTARVDENDPAVMAITGTARYRVDVDEILVDPDPGVDERNVRLFLLGSVMGMLLHKRRLLPLHANAFVIGGKAFAMLGPPGSGKSTLAALLHDKGYALLADDVFVVRVGEGLPPLGSPGLPRLRLWRDALTDSGRDPAHFDHSFVGDSEWDKFDVPVTRSNKWSEEFQIAGLYVLERGNRMLIDRLSIAESVGAIVANTYRGQFTHQLQSVEEHWRMCLQLCSAVPVFRFRRAWRKEQLKAEAELLLEHAERLADAPQSAAGQTPA